MSKRFALLVGMTTYPDDRLAATATNQEIRKLVERLRDPENGRFDRVVPLLNQTAVELQLGIASFLDQEMQPGDLVVFYFAGHSLIHHHNIYLATTDTFSEEYLDATTIEIDFILRRLKANPAQQVILLDCNYSLLGATDRHTDGLYLLANAFQAENRAVLAAHLLTNIALEGLEGSADTDQDGTICFSEMGTYVRSQYTEDEQVAVISNDALDKIPLAFAKTKGAAVPLVTTTEKGIGLTQSSSKIRRFGVIALVLLLMLTFFGFYAVSSGLFSDDRPTMPQPASSATNTARAVIVAASETPSRTPTVAIEESASPTPTSSPTKTAVPSPTATTKSTKEATPEASETPAETETPETTNTPTAEPTETVPTTNTPTRTPTTTPTAEPSVTPRPDSDGVPMDVVAQQAFLRAGPGINYRIIAFPTQGTNVSVIAQNGDGTWYNVNLQDNTSGWLHQDVLEPDDEDLFDDIPIAATIPVPVDEFYDPVVTLTDIGLSVQVYHTYVGTQGDTARFEARLLPETNLVEPAYLNGQELGIGLLIVEFNRVAEGTYSSEQVEVCMVSNFGTPFYCETYSAQKSW